MSIEAKSRSGTSLDTNVAVVRPARLFNHVEEKQKQEKKAEPHAPFDPPALSTTYACLALVPSIPNQIRDSGGVYAMRLLEGRMWQTREG